jgi:hypothetical protein
MKHWDAATGTWSGRIAYELKWRFRRVHNTAFGHDRYEWRGLRTDGLRLECIEGNLADAVDYALRMQRMEISGLQSGTS